MTAPASAPALHLVRRPDPVAHLTKREREVLGLMAEGLDNGAICRQLWIGAKTLERHVQNIFLKLDLPPTGGRHRRVCAVLAYLRSPLSRARPLLPTTSAATIRGDAPRATTSMPRKRPCTSGPSLRAAVRIRQR